MDPKEHFKEMLTKMKKQLKIKIKNAHYDKTFL